VIIINILYKTPQGLEHHNLQSLFYHFLTSFLTHINSAVFNVPLFFCLCFALCFSSSMRRAPLYIYIHVYIPSRSARLVVLWGSGGATVLPCCKFSLLANWKGVGLHFAYRFRYSLMRFWPKTAVTSVLVMWAWGNSRGMVIFLTIIRKLNRNALNRI